MACRDKLYIRMKVSGSAPLSVIHHPTFLLRPTEISPDLGRSNVDISKLSSKSKPLSLFFLILLTLLDLEDG